MKTMMPPDHELLKQFRTCGDEAAFTELVNRHLGLVHSAALRITSQPTLAEEVSQTVFRCRCIRLPGRGSSGFSVNILPQPGQMVA